MADDDFLRRMPIDDLTNTDSGAIEIRRRAFRVAFRAFRQFLEPKYGPSDARSDRETFEIAFDEAKYGLDATRCDDPLPDREAGDWHEPVGD